MLLDKTAEYAGLPVYEALTITRLRSSIIFLTKRAGIFRLPQPFIKQRCSDIIFTTDIGSALTGMVQINQLLFEFICVIMWFSSLLILLHDEIFLYNYFLSYMT